jgi:hypothetical protein
MAGGLGTALSALGFYDPFFIGLLSGPGAFSHGASTIASERAALQYGWREPRETTGGGRGLVNDDGTDIEVGANHRLHRELSSSSLSVYF